MDKRGMLVQGYTIALILILIGFAISLLFFVSLKDSIDSSKQECTASVLARSTFQLVPGNSLTKAPPIKCRPEKICLTMEPKSECEKDFAGENPMVIVLPKNEEEAIKKIEEVSANSMYDCWVMMGKGKLDLNNGLLEKFGLDVAKSLCVICSRISIDKNVNSQWLDRVDVSEYMQTHQVPGIKETYVQAMSDKSVNSFVKADSSEAKEKFESELIDKDRIELEGLEKGANDGKNRQMAYVFMQIRSTKTSDALKNLGNAGATVLIGGTFFTPAGKIAGRAGMWVLKAGMVKFVAIPALVAGGGLAGYSAYNSNKGQEVAAGYCGEFTSNEKSAEGCSLVQGVAYNADDINNFCGKIEGYN
jgi:hypothetical protein